MARYYFDVKDGKRIRDRAGSEFADDAAAIAHAELVARRAAATRPAGVQEHQFVSVLHEGGWEVTQVPVPPRRSGEG